MLQLIQSYFGERFIYEEQIANQISIYIHIYNTNVLAI